MARKDHPFYPHHVLEQVLQFFLLLAVLFALTLWRPAGLEDKADPISTPEHVKPEWYFLAEYQFLKTVPRNVGIVGMILVAALILAFPFLFDRKQEKFRPLQRPWFFFGGITFVILYVFFTAWGHYS
jgi:ubiquinol-cytochrome c reductase cytochrome b subunit